MATKITSGNYLTISSGQYACGNNLYLVVAPTGSRRWMFQYWRGGKRRKMGLGSARVVTVKQAKDRALEARRLMAKDIDPRDDRDKQRADEDGGPLFLDFAAELRNRWMPNLKHRAARGKLARAIGVYCAPLHGLRVREITNQQIITLVLDPLQRKPETLRNVRQRLSMIFRAAIASEIRPDDPADYRSKVQPIMGRPAKRGLVRGHHKPLPYRDLPAFVKQLAAAPDQSARALELLLLTAARTAEILNLRWSQLDLDAGMWVIDAADVPHETVGGEGTKNGIDKITPLPRQAVAILREVPRICDYVFPGRSLRGPMSNMTLLKRLKELTGDRTLTVHGLRGTFRTWCQDEAEFDRETVEHCMHPILGDEAERAYKHGSALKKRAVVLQAWADFATRQPVADNVVALRKAEAN